MFGKEPGHRHLGLSEVQDVGTPLSDSFVKLTILYQGKNPIHIMTHFNKISAIVECFITLFTPHATGVQPVILLTGRLKGKDA
jgi:hypothetical protein